MSTIGEITPEPEISAEYCLCGYTEDEVTPGQFQRIGECEEHEGLFWRVVCLGPIEFTAPLLKLFGSQRITGSQQVGGDSAITGDQEITGSQQVGGDSAVIGGQQVGGDQEIEGDSTIIGNQQVGGDQEITRSQQVGGNSAVTGNQQVGGFVELRPSAEPDASPAPPVGPERSARLWLSAAGDLHCKLTFWPEIEPGVYAETPETAVMTLGDVTRIDDELDAIRARLDELEDGWL